MNNNIKNKQNKEMKMIDEYIKKRRFNCSKRKLIFSSEIYASIYVDPKKDENQKKRFKAKEMYYKKKGKRFKPTFEDYQMKILLENLTTKQRKDILHNLTKSSLEDITETLCQMIYSYKWLFKQIKNGEQNIKDLKNKEIIVIDNNNDSIIKVKDIIGGK